MPVRSKGKLLTGMTIMLGFCVASAGCQCHPVNQPALRSRAVTLKPPSPPPGAVASAEKQTITPAGYVGPLQKLIASTKEMTFSPSAVLARPVAASTWKPVQRVRAQQGDPVVVGQPNAPARDRVQPLAPAVQQAGIRVPRHFPTSQQTLEVMPAGTEQARLRPIARSQSTGGKIQTTGHFPKKHDPLPGVPGVPREFEKQSLPPYIIEPPDLLLIEALGTSDILEKNPIRGQYLVRPDGTVGLGTYGQVYVAGLTLDQARTAIAQLVGRRVKDFDERSVQIDVLAYNSKVFYVITDGGGYGEQVIRLPVTGNETVLDALSQIGGLPAVASKKHIWVARATPYSSHHPKILPVDWKAITQYGSAHTNYQVFPGDRIYVKADPWITIDSGIQKRLSPLDRILGTTLLGAGVVNQIRNIGRSNGGNNSGF